MPLEMRYFILKPKGNSIHAVASRNAMLEYADAIFDTDKEMARELQEWVRKERLAAAREEGDGL